MDLLLEMLLQWISANSSYDTMNIRLPTVVEMTRTEITREFYTDYPDKIPMNGVDDRINALYNAEKEILYVIGATLATHADKFDSPHENPVWREIVLHELIHHVQWQSRRLKDWPCKRFGEKEAYLLGGKYLQQKATADPLLNRRFWASMYSRC